MPDAHPLPRPRQARIRPSLSPYITSLRPWAPLTDAEYATLAPYFVHRGSGRPIFDLRARLDAILWAVCHDGFWRDLPAEMGPWDTAHRQFRRWAHKGVWTQLLQDVATTRDPVLAGLKHWLCRAFRKCWRITGLAGIRLARRLRLHSALRGPIWMMPDPDLSDELQPHILGAIKRGFDQRLSDRFALLKQALALGKAYHRLVAGARWVPRWAAPA